MRRVLIDLVRHTLGRSAVGSLLAVVLLSLGLTLPSGSTAAVLLTDDFSDGDDAGWIQVNRSWHVVGGRYQLDGCYGCDGVPTTGARDGFAYTHVGDPAWTDYTYEFTFDTTNAPSASNDQWAGTSDAHQAMVFFRVQPPLPVPAGAATQYRVDFWSEGQCCHAERVDLIKNVAGPGSFLSRPRRLA
jgi:hypothetical protein